jgi:hypothetical protein
MKYLLILLFLMPRVCEAQEPANTISYVSVAANIGLDTYHSWKSEDRLDAFRKQAIRTGIVFGASEILKRVIHETRPDGSDNMSWPSEHSAFSCVSINVGEGKRIAIEAPIAAVTMIGRVRANKHFWWDTLSGCGIGLAAGLIR